MATARQTIKAEVTAACESYPAADPGSSSPLWGRLNHRARLTTLGARGARAQGGLTDDFVTVSHVKYVFIIFSRMLAFFFDWIHAAPRGAAAPWHA